MMRSNYNDRARLVLSEPQAVYYAGQEISGHIELEIQNPIQFSAINVTFHGEARVHWSEVNYEEYNGIQRTREVAYSGGQVCLHYTQCLYGTVPSGVIDISSLPPGKRELPFKYTLPYNIPSSFKGEKGQISYNVYAYVEYLDHDMGRDELYLEFEVVAPMDLLTDDIVRPLEMHFEEVYGCWCFSSPMSIFIKCPVSGYCPGQSIPINVKVHNESTVEVKKIVFQLVKKELYRSLEPPSEYSTPEEVLETIKTGAILSNIDKGFTCHLPVPPMIAPNMDNCELIDIGFFLKAIIKLTGCNDDLEDEALFFIGLKPIPGTPGAENYVHPLAHMLPNGAPIPAPPLRANVEQVVCPNVYSYPPSYPGQNITPYPTENTNSRPNSHSPLPSQPMSSYPGQNVAPYPTGDSHPSRPEPYPSNPTGGPLPTQPMSSYPGQNVAPYPTGDSHPSHPEPYPPNPTGSPLPSQPMSLYPVQNVAPYHTGDSHPSHPEPYPPNPTGGPLPSQPMSSYPVQNVAPYPTGDSHPSRPEPYPPNPTGGPLPSQPMSSYPGQNLAPYPTGDTHPSRPEPYPPNPTGGPLPSQLMSSYPGQNVAPYPTGDSHPSRPEPYPPNPTGGIAPPYPSQPDPSSRSTSPYPTPNAPYPTPNSPYPTPDSPNPTSNPPYLKTESISMTVLRTQTIGFVLPRGSPHPKANNYQSSPFTPLMQNYPSSALPPST